MTDSLKKIPNKQIDYGKKLGEGGYGIVFKGSWEHHQVAIKTLRLQQLQKDDQESLIQEARIMAKLDHVAVIQFYGVCIDPGHYAILMELMPRGDLYCLLHDKDQSLPWTKRWQIAIDIGSGLKYLHSQKILHRDLKSPNVLLDENLNAKITDFGLAKIKLKTGQTFTYSGGGTVHWMAPELFSKDKKKTTATDVFAYGVLLWEIAARKTPFSGCAEGRVIGFIVTGEREDIPKDCPTPYREVVASCWHQDPKKRLAAGAALSLLQKASPATKNNHFVTSLNKPGFFSRIASAWRAWKPFEKKTEEIKDEWALFIEKYKEKSTEEEYREKDKTHQMQPFQSWGSAPSCFEDLAKKEYPPAYLQLIPDYPEYSWDNEAKTRAAIWRPKAEQSITWFQIEAKKGTPERQYDLGRCYELGIGVEEDQQYANKLYTKAANKGYAPAQWKLEMYRYWGSQLKPKSPKAVQLLKSAARQNHYGALIQLCRYYEFRDNPNIKEVVKYAKQLVYRCRDRREFYRLGYLHEKNESIYDKEKAIGYYKRAASEGVKFAQDALDRLSKQK